MEDHKTHKHRRVFLQNITEKFNELQDINNFKIRQVKRERAEKERRKVEQERRRREEEIRRREWERRMRELSEERRNKQSSCSIL